MVVVLAILLVSIPKTPVHAQSIVSDSTDEETTGVITGTFNTDLLAIPSPTLADVEAGEPLVVDKPILSLREKAEQMVEEAFGKGQFKAFDAIITHESHWNPNAVNSSSGACGLGQALPCSKISDHSEDGQLKWVISYIADRYGTPNHAWSFWRTHLWY